MIGYEPHERAADPTITERMMTMVRSLTDDGIQADMDAALAAAGVERPVAAIGFCLGARAVAVALLRNPERYVAVGGADTMQPLSAQRPFLDAAPDDPVDVEVYDGADHGFTWPDHASYHESAATESFARSTAKFGRAVAA